MERARSVIEPWIWGIVLATRKNIGIYDIAWIETILQSTQLSRISDSVLRFGAPNLAPRERVPKMGAREESKAFWRPIQVSSCP